MQLNKLLEKGRLNWDLIHNTLSLVGTTVITSGLGFIFWWLAARQFPTESVGLASAAISTMTLIGTFSMIGLGTVLIGELPRQPAKRFSLVMTGLLVAGFTGFIAGLLFSVVGANLKGELQPFFSDPVSCLIFAAGVALTSLTMVLDQALIGLLRGNLQLWRNGLFAGIKLVALGVFSILLADKLGLTIYTTWLIGNLLSLVCMVGYAAHKGVSFHAFKPEWRLLRGLGWTAISHHALNLALLSPNLILPVLVTTLLSASSNAHFYVAFMVATIVFMGPAALTTVLFAVGASNVGALAEKVKFTVRLSAIIGLAANIFIMFSADFLLGIFGPSYAQEAAWTLRILGLGVFAVIIKDHFVAIHRIRGTTGKGIVPVAIGSLLEVIGAAIGTLQGGLTGLALGFVLAMMMEATIMGPLVYRAIRSTRNPKEVIPPLSPINTELELADQVEVSMGIFKN